MNYIKEALRTESIDHFNVFSARILHAAIGISTEVMELVFVDEADTAHFIEELGDILWYVAVAADELGTSFDDLLRFARPEDNVAKQLIEHAGGALDCVKRGLFYGVNFDRDRFQGHLCQIVHAVQAIAGHQGYSLEEVQARNIAKLAKRYPEKFLTERAVNRNVAEEMSVFT